MKVAIHTRVSAAEDKADRLRDHCAAKGYPVGWLLKLPTDPSLSVLVVEHKDRRSRFGYNHLEQLLKMQDRRIEVIDLALNGKEDLIQDFVSIVSSFCARLSGQGRSRRLIAELTRPPAQGNKHAVG